MADPVPPWPFGAGDGGPDSRPLVVKLDGVLVAILEDARTGEHAKASLAEHGVDYNRLRLYTSEQMLAYDEEFRTNRKLTGRLVGAFVDPSESMAKYLEYAGEGCSALWVFVPIREDANRVVRLLADEPARFIWYHEHGRVETIPMA